MCVILIVVMAYLWVMKHVIQVCHSHVPLTVSRCLQDTHMRNLEHIYYILMRERHYNMAIIAIHVTGSGSQTIVHTATTPCSCHVYGRLKIIPIHFVNYYDVIRGLARKNDSQFDHKQCVCESNIEMNHRFLLTRYILHK